MKYLSIVMGIVLMSSRLRAASTFLLSAGLITKISATPVAVPAHPLWPWQAVMIVLFAAVVRVVEPRPVPMNRNPLVAGGTLHPLA